MTDKIRIIKTEQALNDEERIHFRLFLAIFKRTFIPVICLTALIAAITLLVTMRLPAQYTTTAILHYTPPAISPPSPDTILEQHIKRLNAIENINANRINDSYLISVSFETTAPTQSRAVATSILNSYIAQHAINTPAAQATDSNNPPAIRSAENSSELAPALAKLKNEILSQKPISSATADLSIFQVPSVPIATTGERNLIITLIAALSWFGLCQLIILITSRYQERVHSIDDVKNKLHTEIIAFNLQGKYRCNEDEKARVERYSHHSFKRALLLNNELKDKKILSLTSVNPKEGITLITWQLARMLNKNKKILIIDLDINQHSRFINWLSSSFELRNSGNADSHTREPNKIYSSTLKNIHVMPLEENRLLSSTHDELQTLISHLHELRNTYDLILFDSPPLVKSPVALIAAKIADGTLLILKPGRTSVRMIQRYMQRLLKNNTPVSGVILNNVGINSAVAKSLKLGINWDIS